MAFSEDRYLGGRIIARQPIEGFRSGTDAVMLAAAVQAKVGEELFEMGSGVGVASLCVAARVADCHITGTEIAPALVTLASENARANKLEERVRFEVADVFQLPARLRREFDHVFCNPPFHHGAGEMSSNEDRARALSDRAGLGNWMKAAFARVKSDGTLTVILRTDRLAEAIQAMPQHGVAVFPLWARVGEVAKRVILQFWKNSRAPLVLYPGLVLHGSDGRYTPEADAVLRDAASLILPSCSTMTRVRG
jgi:tRNA1(Val) A37 N6-methylase TrmN6